MEAHRTGNIVLLEFAEICIRPDSTLFVTFLPGWDIDYRHIRKLMATIGAINAHHIHPIILDVRYMNSLGMDARSYLLSERAAKQKDPLALLVSNSYQKALYHLACRVFKPSFKIQAFRKEQAATEWVLATSSYQQQFISSMHMGVNAA